MASSPPPHSSSSSSLSASRANSPTHKGHDYITNLPPEILQNISSYLYASHFPDKDIHYLDGRYSGNPYKFHESHDLANLSRAGKRLYQQTNEWAHHFLHANRAVTKYRVYTTPKAAAKQQTALQKLLRWSARNCVFCGKTSQRKAILMNGLHCCRGCDREQWPEKITDTEARKLFGLFKNRFVVLQGSTQMREGGRRVPEVKELRYGTYICMGVVTTMYLRKDVEAYVDALRESLGDADPLVVRKARRREKAVALKSKKMPIVIEDDDDDDDDEDDDGGAVEANDDGVKSGAVFQEPIVVEDD